MLDSGPRISIDAQDLLVDWYTTKPVFALMGEYSAGKSTLLNLLLDQAALPTKVTATNLPPVWLTFSDTPTCQGLRFDGTLENVDLTDTTDDVRDHYVVLRMGVPADRLRDTDIIDTPGISDPKLEKGALNFLGDYIDFTLWLSAANQAWRQTEKMAWQAFPDTLRADSVLLLTRADKLRNPKDVGKVVKRCASETADLFREIVPLMTTKAATVDHADRHDDADGDWAATGGAALESALATSLARAAITRKVAALAPKPSRQKKSVDVEDPIFTHAATPPAPSSATAPAQPKPMNTDISDLGTIAGFIGGCLVDAETGLMMVSEGGGDHDLEAAGAANANVLNAKRATNDMLDRNDPIDDIVITLGSQVHLIRPLTDAPTVFIYAALDKATADLDTARTQLKNIETALSL